MPYFLCIFLHIFSMKFITLKKLNQMISQFYSVKCCVYHLTPSTQLQKGKLFAWISVEKILKILVIGNSYNVLYCLSLLGMPFEKIDC